jgi:hypothetical protein
MAAVSAIVSGVAAVGSAVVKGVSANKAAKRAGKRASNAQKAIENVKNNRGPVINPYEGVSNVSDMAKNLSGGMSNPYANLGVATQAAQMQAEEADIALANTLDTLRATGSGAGGATALAQAALRSKKGISASIEQQEASNEKLRADGEQQLQDAKLAEEKRIQGIQMGEAQRVQAAEVQGKSFKFNAEEARNNSELERLSGQQVAAQNQQEQSRLDRAGAISGGITGLAGSGIFDKLGKQ